MIKKVFFVFFVSIMVLCSIGCNDDSDENAIKVKQALEHSNLTESDLTTVGKALTSNLFPWDWALSGEKNQNYYRLRAFETGFTAEAWNTLSKKQQKLVRAYMRPTHYSTRIFKNADFTFWPNRPPRNRPTGMSDTIDYYIDAGGPDWKQW